MSKLKNAIAFKAEGHSIEFLFTDAFNKQAGLVFSRDELSGMLNYLSARPHSGKVVQNTRGLRKLRWSAKGQGKRGGGRVVYYFRDLNMPLLLLAVYAKGEKSDLRSSEYKAIEAKVETITAKLTWDKLLEVASQSTA